MAGIKDIVEKYTSFEPAHADFVFLNHSAK